MSRKFEVLAPLQTGLWDEGVRIPNEERFVVGLNSAQVVEKLFNSHGVSRFSYTQFNPESTYPMDIDQPYWWNEWTGVGELQSLSEEIVTKTTTFEAELEGDQIVVCDVLGIGSMVDLGNGYIRQVKMLDLDIDIDENPVSWLKRVGLGSGVVLKTERSFHYYGFDMLSESSWEAWIKALIRSPECEWVFGSAYLPMCLDRGYSALRVFGYKGTSKSETPTVVARF